MRPCGGDLSVRPAGVARSSRVEDHLPAVRGEAAGAADRECPGGRFRHDYAGRARQRRRGQGMKKARKCRYCAAGKVANSDGEHWIVKSIIPARIDIRICTAAKSEAKA